MRPWIVWAAALSAGVLACSAASAQALGGLYVHDDGLAKRAADADAAARAAETLKPYDDQLANLKTFAVQEDAANVALIIARRDAAAARLVATPAAGRPAEVSAQACDRLKALVGNVTAWAGGSGAVCKDDARMQQLANLSEALSNFASLKQLNEATVTSDIAQAAREHPGKDPPKCLSNGTVDTGVLVDGVPKDHVSKTTFSKDCTAFQMAVTALGSVLSAVPPLPNDRLVAGGSSLALAKAATETKAAKVEADGSLAALKAQLKTLADDAKAGDAASLDTLRTFLNDNLENANAVTKVAGLKGLQADLDALALGVSCAGPKTVATTAAASECDAVKSDSTEARTKASWELLQAITAASDLAAKKGKTERWVAAAQAIVAAYKADAELQAQAEKTAARAAQQRYEFMAREVSLLATAAILANGGAVLDGGGQVAIPVCDAKARFDCAAPYFIASWNAGRAPAQVLAYRELQAFRETNVKRQRIAAAEQQALMLAGSGSLKAYSDGGLNLETFAKILLAIGLISVAED